MSAEDDHTRAEADSARAETDRTRAGTDTLRAGDDHRSRLKGPTPGAVVLFVLALVCIYLIAYAITAGNATNQLHGCYRASLDRLSNLNSFQVVQSTDAEIGKIANGQSQTIKNDRAQEAINLSASATISESLIDQRELSVFKSLAGERDNLTAADTTAIKKNGYSCSGLYHKPSILPWDL